MAGASIATAGPDGPTSTTPHRPPSEDRPAPSGDHDHDQCDQQTRLTLRCSSCSLVQFITRNHLCRRCRTSLIPPVDPQPAPEPEPEPVLIPPAICPAFHTLEQSLPVVLRWLRLRRGLSQPALGAMLGVPRTYVSKIENRAAMPTLRNLERIAAALEVEPGKIFRMCEYLMNGERERVTL